MVTASFFRRGAVYTGFKIQGHAGYASAGQDIVCAAVSAMTMLTVNLVEEAFGVPSSVKVDEGRGDIEFAVKVADTTAGIVIEGFKNELAALAVQYPQNILVKE